MAKKPYTTSIYGSVQHTAWNSKGTSFPQPPNKVLSSHATEDFSGVSRRKPEGFIPPTPYSASGSFLRPSRGKIHRTVKNRLTGLPTTTYPFRESDGVLGQSNTICNYGWNIGNLVPGGFSVPQRLEDQALIKARLEMKAGDFNLGVAFAERNKTAQLVGDTASRLASAYRSLRKGDWKRAGRQLGLTNPHRPRGSSVPQKWLEYQYGWRPLIQDVYGSVDALTRHQRHDWLVVGKGFAREDLSRSESWENSNSLVDGVVEGWRGVYVRIDALPSNWELLALSAMGITNPALVAWEMVPFSFLVDWFLPIGSYLESLDAMLGYDSTNTFCSISHFVTAESRIQPRSGTYSDGNYLYEFKANASPKWEKRYALSRRALGRVPLPTMPRIKDPRSLGHMANGLALLASAFGRPRR